jgi:hypothetical protein
VNRSPEASKKRLIQLILTTRITTSTPFTTGMILIISKRNESIVLQWDDMNTSGFPKPWKHNGRRKGAASSESKFNIINDIMG